MKLRRFLSGIHSFLGARRVPDSTLGDALSTGREVRRLDLGDDKVLRKNGLVASQMNILAGTGDQSPARDRLEP